MSAEEENERLIVAHRRMTIDAYRKAVRTSLQTLKETDITDLDKLAKEVSQVGQATAMLYRVLVADRDLRTGQ